MVQLPTLHLQLILEHETLNRVVVCDIVLLSISLGKLTQL